MVMSMIERVALAIFKVDYPDDENIDGLFWERKGSFYIEQARAAIEAMREPTDAMVLAGSVYYQDSWRKDHAREDTSTVYIWSDMITAALAEPVERP